jgi:hypothetical protein
VPVPVWWLVMSPSRLGYSLWSPPATRLRRGHGCPLGQGQRPQRGQHREPRRCRPPRPCRPRSRCTARPPPDPGSSVIAPTLRRTAAAPGRRDEPLPASSTTQSRVHERDRRRHHRSRSQPHRHGDAAEFGDQLDRFMRPQLAMPVMRCRMAQSPNRVQTYLGRAFSLVVAGSGPGRT